ncbi:CapA family protein [Actinomyces urogenitalis]|uniref:CapA family protein n=1 Tax=Actinomyces urogenitalis TaxID=103621 RepID=UPI00050F0C95|nr:CapA family protein [Actinomyces urogenitalis]KGF00078.1 capsule biosynthesis protein [Actinomyces urogenitalis S6-C4]MDU5427606.1 CapA family protein [Actinomyces urogenitalis]MDU5874488.1 CapA family protein [Actinomyces urogenitalis]
MTSHPSPFGPGRAARPTSHKAASHKASSHAGPSSGSRLRRGLFALLVVAVLGPSTYLFLTRQATTAPAAQQPSSAVASLASSPALSPRPTPSPTPPPDIHLTIGYAGDVLTHMPVINDTAGGQGDISPMIAASQPWYSGVDLALCGMEVPVSPRGVASGYPMFGSLPGVVAALGSTGWDGCATASNHAWDQGWSGVLTTADTLQANGMGFSGTNRTEAEAARPYQLYQFQREGRTVTVAQLSTTYSLNGMTADPAWAVNLNDVQWAADQARAAREAGADLVVLHSQIGEEYTRDPVASQKEYAQAIADTGQIDVLFSAHPHVPQTNELLAGGPGGRGMWVSYSAGNFISNQSEALGTIMTTIGLFVWVDVTVSEDASGQRSVSVDALHWHPFTVDNAVGHTQLDLGAAHAGAVPAWTSLSATEIERRWQAVTGIVNPQTYSDQVPVATGEAPVPLPRG